MTSELNDHSAQSADADRGPGARRIVSVTEDRAPFAPESSQRGRKAVGAYAAEHAEPQESPDDPDVAEWVIRYIITDLCHYAARLDLNPEYLANSGVGRYQEESRGIAQSAEHIESEGQDRLPSAIPAAKAASSSSQYPHTALADLAAARRELSWHDPEATNTATGAPHRITLNHDGTFTVLHNLGCHRAGGRRDTPTGELICDIDAYLDATDDGDRPRPGNYWVIVEVFGPSEESVEAEWIPNGTSPTAS